MITFYERIFHINTSGCIVLEGRGDTGKPNKICTPPSKNGRLFAYRWNGHFDSIELSVTFIEKKVEHIPVDSANDISHSFLSALKSEISGACRALTENDKKRILSGEYVYANPNVKAGMISRKPAWIKEQYKPVFHDISFDEITFFMVGRKIKGAAKGRSEYVIAPGCQSDDFYARWTLSEKTEVESLNPDGKVQKNLFLTNDFEIQLQREIERADFSVPRDEFMERLLDPQGVTFHARKKDGRYLLIPAK